MSKNVVQSAMCNGRKVKLVHDTEVKDWYVREPYQDLDDVTAFADFEDAEAFYKQRVQYWSNEPNWEMQAEYDEAHGTYNGYAPWQYNREH